LVVPYEILVIQIIEHKSEHMFYDDGDTIMLVTILKKIILV